MKLYISTLLFIISSMSIYGQEGNVPDAVEYQALVDLYNATDGANWTDNSNWLQGTTNVDFGTWHGITVENGDVTSIDLYFNGLNGDISLLDLGTLTELQFLLLEANNLSGNLAFDFSNLIQLKIVNVHNNDLSGSLPESLFQLSSIEEIRLSINHFEGTIPDFFNSTTSLKKLLLHYNYTITGEIPSSFYQCSTLKEVTLGGNSMFGGVSSDISGMTSLYHFNINGNNFSGPLPEELGLLPNIGVFTASQNEFTGNIPASFGTSKSLIRLYIDQNQLNGSIIDFREASNLQILNLSENDFTGTITNQFEGLSSLQRLYLNFTNQSGPVPSYIASLESLEFLYLISNHFSEIPSFKGLSNTSALKIYVQNNELDFGSLESNFDAINTNPFNTFYYSPQAEIGEEQTLSFAKGEQFEIPFSTSGSHNSYQWQKKDVNGNWQNITGATSTNYMKASFESSDIGEYRIVVNNDWVTDLTLYSKTITIEETSVCNGGVVDDALEYQALVDLYNATNGEGWTDNTNWLQGNCSEDFSAWYGVTVENGDVVELVLAGNNLNGTLPSSLVNLTQLRVLNLSSLFEKPNVLAVPFPVDYMSLTNLESLYLSFIGLTGSIPSEIGQLVKLKYLSLSQNALTDTVPIELYNLLDLELLDLGHNDLEGEIHANISNLSSLRILQLPSNKFTGTILDKITSLTLLEHLFIPSNQFTGSFTSDFGNLINLGYFWGGNNTFSGSIPPSFGNLSKLYELNLYNNNFSGPLPEELSQLTAMKRFSINYNNFSGVIPPIFAGMTDLYKLNVESNEFEGAFPGGVLNLANLDGVWLQNNKFTSIPNFSAALKVPDYDVIINYNHLDFGSIEPLFTGVDEYNFDLFSYDRQAEIGTEQTISLDIGDMMELFVPTGGTRNIYQWQKKFLTRWENIPGATSQNYSKTFQNEDAGEYRLVVSNEWATLLTLYSKVIKVVGPDACDVLINQQVIDNSCENSVTVNLSNIKGDFFVTLVHRSPSGFETKGYYSEVRSTDNRQIKYFVNKNSGDGNFVVLVQQVGCSVIYSEPFEIHNFDNGLKLESFWTHPDTGGGDGSIITQVSGGTPPYSYAWSGGLGNFSRHVNNVTAGSYDLTVTDSQGCSIQLDQFVVGSLDCNDLNLSTVVTHNSDPLRIDVELIVSGGFPPYNIMHFPAGLTSFSPTSYFGRYKLSYSGSVTGIFKYIVTDSQGCSAIDEFYEPGDSECQFNSTIDYENCSGQSILTVDIQSGVGPFTLVGIPVISEAPFLFQSIPLGVSTIPFDVAQHGDLFFFQINDQGCNPSKTQLFSVEPIDITSTLTLEYQVIPETGTIDLTVTGGTAPYTYAWSGGLPAQEDQTNVPPGIYNVTVTDANGCSQYLDNIEITAGCGQEEFTCTSVMAMSQTGTGRWTQVSGPSQSLIAELNNPTTEVTLGRPGRYKLKWTSPDSECDGNVVTINFDPGFEVSITPTDRRNIQTLSHAKFYSPSGGTDSGVDYPREGGASYDGVFFDQTSNHLYVTNWSGAIWVLDLNTNTGSNINVNTVVLGDKYNLTSTSPRSIHVDTDNQILYAAGWPGSAANKGGAMWRYDLVTGVGKAFYPGMIPEGGGDPFPKGIGDYISQYKDNIIISLTRFRSSFPDGGIYIYNETSKTGKFLSPETTATGGIYEVNGPPIIEESTQTNLMFEFDGNEYLYAGFTYEGIWVYNVTTNTSKILSVESTSKGGEHEVLGDPLQNNENYALTRVGTKLFMNSWEGGAWVYDFAFNRGTLLSKSTTAVGGTHEVNGDPLPSDYGAGLAYDYTNNILYLGQRTSYGVPVGTIGGLWRYDLRKNYAERFGIADVGNVIDNNATYPVAFDPRSNRAFSTSHVPFTGGGLLVSTFTKGVKLCTGGSITLKANTLGSGVSYQWYEDGQAISGATSSTYTTSAEGYFTVKVTGGGCTVESDAFIVAIEDFENLLITPDASLSLCQGEEAVISVPSGYASYQWYKDGTPITNTNKNVYAVEASGFGSYTVEVMTAEGCLAAAPNSVVVTGNNLGATYTTLFNDALGTGTIDVTVSGGVEPYSYSWSSGLAGTQDQVNLPFGTYDVTITDAAGCSISLNNILVGFSDCAWDAAIDVVQDDGSGNGSVTINITGAGGAITYTWSGGLPPTASQSGLSAGVYSVTISDAGGCSEIYHINIDDNCPAISAYRVADIDVSCNGASDGVIAAFVVNGSGPFDFNLYDFETGVEVDVEPEYFPLLPGVAYFNQLLPGEYFITIDQAECQVIDIVDYLGVSIQEPEELSAAFTVVDDSGIGDGSITLDVSGGTAPYTFVWTGGLSPVEDQNNTVAAGYYNVTITDSRGCDYLLDDIWVNGLVDCDPEHPQRFLMSLVSTTESVCNNGLDTGEITFALDFINQPPFAGVTYNFRLVRKDGTFNPFTGTGFSVVDEVAGVTIDQKNYQYTFTNVAASSSPYSIFVISEGLTPPQAELCSYTTFNFISNINIESVELPDATFSINEPLVKEGDLVIAEPINFNGANQYQYDWGDGAVTNTKFVKAVHRYTAGEYDIALTVTTPEGCTSQSIETVRVFNYVCESPIPNNGGSFYVDEKTGKIVFKRDNCPGNYVFSCLSAKAEPSIFDRAVSASAVTYSDEWPYEREEKNGLVLSENFNQFETGEQGRWRAKNYYSYSTDLFETDKNYSSGTFKVEDFSWKYEDANNPSKWLKSTTVERYSPNGEAIQERNILNIPSAVKFGYNESLPYLTIQNGEYQDGYFESFENNYSGVLEEYIAIDGNGITLSNLYSHAGKKSALLSGDFKQGKIFISEQLINNGLMLRAWVRPDQQDQIDNIAFKIFDKDGVTVSTSVATSVTNVEDWYLIESVINDFGSLQTGDLREHSDVLQTAISYNGEGSIRIDDIRIQPGDAQMTTYVYDSRNLRLLTIFDDQHFGLYYQYDREGKLIRKEIETERGKKTIQETHYNTPKVGRDE
ncbi:hypothetical protein [Fulvivirga sp.]|uniref:hypothetical protein n=1 Tax=Fulvivirga sp. TaxID=1931237 RepID=UPI0032EF631A